MTTPAQIDPCLVQAIEKIKAYIGKTTGTAATSEEIAHALTRFFVLKEIKEFVEMDRQEKG